MHLKPTAEFQNINFDIWKKLWRGSLYKYPTKNIGQGRQSYCPPLARLKVLPGYLTDLSA